MAGHLELKNANVKWFLSTDRNDLPDNEKESGTSTFRSIKVDGEEIQFSQWIYRSSHKSLRRNSYW